MYEKFLCKHLQDADRLEIVEIQRIASDYVFYRCPICRVEGRISRPAFFNKWEFWRFLQILRSESAHSESAAHKCFVENVIKVIQFMYNEASVDTIKFESVTDEHFKDPKLS
jgi:hypothetical protein